MVAEGAGAGESMKGELGVRRCRILNRRDKQQGPTAQHRDYIQHSVTNHNGK